ncbi:hypothetical protein KC887_00395 [Candidatus Kaiserbacteria bacterium]|nr:hypothetical protein [Candidatus Kaiserbacteria bacterium]
MIYRTGDYVLYQNELYRISSVINESVFRLKQPGTAKVIPFAHVSTVKRATKTGVEIVHKKRGPATTEEKRLMECLQLTLRQVREARG